MTEDAISKQAASEAGENDNNGSAKNEICSAEEEEEENEKQQSPAEPQEDSSPSASSAAQQTRFNFYTSEVAEEIRKQTSQEEEPKKPSNRFHFYNPAEVGPIEHKRTCSAQPSVTAASASPIHASPTVIMRSPSLPRKMTEREVDSNEILRSLQETERQHSQRRSIRHGNKLPQGIMSAAKKKPRNPYKDAIQEALQMLQQQQQQQQSISSNTTDGNVLENTGAANVKDEDVVMQMRLYQEASPETRKKERLYRKERIVKYASRMDETRSISPPRPEQAPSTTTTTRTTTTTTTNWTPPTPGQVSNEGAEALIRMRSDSNDDEVEDTPQSLDTQPEDVGSVHSTEVQEGVKQVLMAILERADSKSANNTPSQVNTETELNALTKAMEHLLQPSLSFETVSTVRSRRPNRRESQQQQQQQQQALDDELALVSNQNKNVPMKPSVVEELLLDARNGTLQEKEKKIVPRALEEYITPVSSTELRVDESQQSIEVVESGDVFEEDEEEETATSTSSTLYDEEEEEDPKNVSVDESTLTHLLGKLRRRSDADRQVDDTEDDEYDARTESANENSLINVLGPLSRGGNTGVVLETTSYEEGPPPSPPDDDGSVPLSPASIYETLSSAVKDAESFMSYISGGYPAVKDKYSTGDDEETAIIARGPPRPEHGDFDADAHELMRSLCAHLLPYGVDKSADSSKIERIPVWDESNPDEAGYRIIRLSKRQLRAVELEFEKMVKSVKRISERDLKGTLSKTADAKDDWNGIPDDDFARDLEEAEELLDQEEKKIREEDDRAKARNKPEESEDESDEESPSESGSGSSDESGTMEGTRSPLLSDDDTLLTTHRDFPGVKPTGKGEIGDLEYFHLPIIYKSNVTGFEPTKDLYLEPGNIVAGQYLVESELGSAAFSTAYRCVDLSSEVRTTEKGEEVQEEVCLKVIKNTKDFFDQSLDEIKILELLRQTGKCHESHILEMKTFFYHREHLIIVTELLRQNLFEFGKFILDSDEERYFTRTRLCYITRQVLIALDFIHKMGLVHSDVKPENILLSSYSRAQVKLIDFGSSCFLTDRQSSYIQSRSYRAPEVVLGLPYDGKIDMWSLGCVVAEMYTGEVTFQNDSIVSMLSRIEAICGSFPRHMIAQGRQSNRFFTKSGLLFEHVDSDNRDDGGSGDNSLLDVFQPKRTSLAARLGLPDIETEDEALFVDFCSKLLAVDPDSRPTAADALKHPWIVAGESITEEDIKYPSK